MIMRNARLSEEQPFGIRREDVPIRNQAELAEIADNHALEVWGQDIARGPAIPLHDGSGELCAVLFSYARNADTHPNIEELMEAADIKAVGETQSQERLIARFGSVTLSTNRDNPPVLRVSHYIHPLFSMAMQARREAQNHLDSEQVEPARVFFLGLHAEFLEFQSGEDRVVVNLNSLRCLPVDEMMMKWEAMEPDEHQIELNNELWMQALNPEPRIVDISRLREANVIPYWELIPIINWTWWCVPTAYSMVFGYWDNYVKGVGVTTGYGRLVKYWFDHPKFNNNVPELIDQMIDPSTGTWRKGFKDIADFINKTYGYAFKKDEVAASFSNDWAWKEIKAEVDAGRPLVWSTGFYGSPHATTAFGYAERSTGKFVKLLTTWGNTAAAQRDEVVHSVCSGIGCVRPGGGNSSEHLVLEGPRGGESTVVGLTTKIGWFVWGKQIKTIDVAASYDGGLTWSAIAKGMSVKFGVGSMAWVPQKPTATARVRIEGRDASGDIVAADGSRDNFTVASSVKMKPLKP